ncbi:DNA-binding transcriptional regulator, LysR family [Saccharopolyspora kobensis]|uniref:DNA-binding transcriptional regulator, LysR family n=1 Tax=Saccharopolyspora kobensis TaxID=146035 RepID=A0A1H5ZGF0_9PSEU|nr:LysR family transcriptional regulator [Saccharopolyspora kobensis]SEG35518.1 DNA-binding transcriptional regulator, LysR family [Saccharopolyspora kobensis]SFF18284.1 DNA-binding transcriptional regulator, LysR family [Saccharopolyspora kobensis]
MELDLGAVRAFVTVADEQHFGAAADQLNLTQQAVSRRIAKLEAALSTTLLHRTQTGARLNESGAALLPHARALLVLADQAVDSVRIRNRPLRVDVNDTRLPATELVREFHDSNADVEIDIITSNGLRSGRTALTSGSIDATVARVMGTLDPVIKHRPAYLGPLHVLVGRTHPLADRRQVRLTHLRDSIAWMPTNEPGSEWADFYDCLAREFGLTIDTSGPNFGLDHMLDHLAASPDRFTFGGELLRVPWHPQIVQIPIVDPTPVYPHSLLWKQGNRHPVLPRLIDHVTSRLRPFDPERQWMPPADIRALDLAAAADEHPAPDSSGESLTNRWRGRAFRGGL